LGRAREQALPAFGRDFDHTHQQLRDPVVVAQRRLPGLGARGAITVKIRLSASRNRR
jgi:hypothetical protein